MLRLPRPITLIRALENSRRASWIFQFVDLKEEAPCRVTRGEARLRGHKYCCPARRDQWLKTNSSEVSNEKRNLPISSDASALYLRLHTQPHIQPVTIRRRVTKFHSGFRRRRRRRHP